MVFGNIKFSLKQYVHTKKEMKLVIPFFFCITRLLHRIWSLVTCVGIIHVSLYNPVFFFFLPPPLPPFFFSCFNFVNQSYIQHPLTVIYIHVYSFIHLIACHCQNKRWGNNTCCNKLTINKHYNIKRGFHARNVCNIYKKKKKVVQNDKIYNNY